MTTATNRREVEIDTRIAAAYSATKHASGEFGAAIERVWSRIPSDLRKKNEGRYAYGFAEGVLLVDGEFVKVTIDEAIEAVKGAGLGEVISDRVAELASAREAFKSAREAQAIVEREYEGWSRFFLVTSSNGHIHSSMNCSTCYMSTVYGWLPQLSGLDEAAAVADQGEILCSVCFPTAPVAWTEGESKATKEARAEREAAKAAKAAAKAAAVCSGSGQMTDRIIEGTYYDSIEPFYTTQGRCLVCNAKKWLDRVTATQGLVPKHNTPKARAPKAVK